MVKARTLVPAMTTNWFLIFHFHHAFTAWLANLNFPSFVSLLYNARVRGADYIRKTMVYELRPTLVQLSLLKFTTVYQVNGCIPRSHRSFAGNTVDNRSQMISQKNKRDTRMVNIDQKTVKNFHAQRPTLIHYNSII